MVPVTIAAALAAGLFWLGALAAWLSMRAEIVAWREGYKDIYEAHIKRLTAIYEDHLSVLTKEIDLLREHGRTRYEAGRNDARAALAARQHTTRAANGRFTRKDSSC